MTQRILTGNIAGFGGIEKLFRLRLENSSHDLDGIGEDFGSCHVKPPFPFEPPLAAQPVALLLRMGRAYSRAWFDV